MITDGQAVDEHWTDDRARCRECNELATVRVRRFTASPAGKYVSARCVNNAAHSLTPETSVYLTEVRNRFVAQS